MAVPLMCTLGHIATTEQLAGLGISAFRIRTALNAGRIKRLRRGTYACSHLPTAESDVASVGGALTCISVLRESGVWAGNSSTTHVQLAPGTAKPARPDMTFHWEIPRFGMDSRWRASRTQAMWRAVHCLDEENTVAALESALHLGFLSAPEVRRIVAHVPRRLAAATRKLEPDSGSGNETIVRRRLQAEGYRVAIQANVPGMGHQDLLVEDCVGLEVDGREWHGQDRYAVDHARDLHAEGFGRHVIRISTSQIHVTWPTTMAVLERVVRDAVRERDRRIGRPIDLA